jgi:hypothetical protein
MIELVEIVNPVTGRKGKVAATSRAATKYRQPPSQRAVDEPSVDPDLPANLGPAQPARNASTEEWRAYASDPRTPNGLSPDEAEQLGRDELIDHFNTESKEN